MLCLVMGIVGMFLGAMYMFVYPDVGPNVMIWVISFVALYKGMRNWFRIKDLGKTL